MTLTPGGPAIEIRQVLSEKRLFDSGYRLREIPNHPGPIVPARLCEAGGAERVASFMVRQASQNRPPWPAALASVSTPN